MGAFYSTSNNTKKNNENLPVMVVHVVEVAVVVVVYHHYPFGVNCCYQLHSFHRLLEAVAYLAVLLTHLLLSNGREKKEEKYRKYKYIYYTWNKWGFSRKWIRYITRSIATRNNIKKKHKNILEKKDWFIKLWMVMKVSKEGDTLMLILI